MKWVRWLTLFISLPLAIGAERKLEIVTSFLPAYCLTVNITRELANVQNLLPGQVSLHDYQLSPQEVRKLSAADLIVVNGLGLEGFLDRAIANAGPGAKQKLVELSAGLKEQLITEEVEHGDHSHGQINPHIWLDPSLAAHSVTNILLAIQKADPARSSEYARNAAELLQRLGTLDQEISQKTGPIKTVGFITYHNAFPYFARRFGLNLLAVVEKVPEISPSPRERTRLSKTIREQKAKTLFTEPRESSRLAQQIARDTGIALGELDPLETGEMKPDSYERGMRRNAEELVKALAE